MFPGSPKTGTGRERGENGVNLTCPLLRSIERGGRFLIFPGSPKTGTGRERGENGVNLTCPLLRDFLRTRSISRPRCGLSLPRRLGADTVAESGNWKFNQHLRSRKN